MLTFEMTESSWATLDGDEDASSHEIRRDIIAVGASAGGLTATCRLLGGLPDSFDSAILVALDVGSQPACSVLQILSCYCRLPISFATDGALVRRNCVLVAPAHCHVRVTPPGIIRLEETHSFSRTSPCMNRLFESCAATYGRRVIGVALSGRPREGAAGLRRIEAAGGVGMVQSPKEAAGVNGPARSMRHTRSAYCSTVDEMVPLFLRLASGLPVPEALERANGKEGTSAVDLSDRGQPSANVSSSLSRLGLRQRRWLQRVLG